MRRRFKLIGYVVLLLILILLTAFVFLVVGKTNEIVKARGFVEPAEHVKVKPSIGGIIEKVCVEEGDEVEKGDTLIIIRREDLELQVKQAGQNLTEAKTRQRELEEDYKNLDSSESAEVGVSLVILYDAERRAGIAKERYDIAEQLFKKEAISFEEKEEKRLNRDLSESYYQTLKYRIDLLRNRYPRQIEEAKKRVELAKKAHELAERRLKEAVILAPISGILLTPNPDELAGVRVVAGQAILELAAQSEMNFIATIDEINIPDIQTGQEVNIFINALPHRRYGIFKGEVTHISPKLDVAQEKITFEAEIEIKEPWVTLSSTKFYLRPGLSGEAKIITKHDIKWIDHLLGKEKE